MTVSFEWKSKNHDDQQDNSIGPATRKKQTKMAIDGKHLYWHYCLPLVVTLLTDNKLNVWLKRMWFQRTYISFISSRLKTETWIIWVFFCRRNTWTLSLMTTIPRMLDIKCFSSINGKWIFVVFLVLSWLANILDLSFFLFPSYNKIQINQERQREIRGYCPEESKHSRDLLDHRHQYISFLLSSSCKTLLLYFYVLFVGLVFDVSAQTFLFNDSLIDWVTSFKYICNNS